MIPQASQLTRLNVALKDLDIAPENPRFHEIADEHIPNLAQSLAPDAAGQLLPLLVRKGTKKEKPYMVLDGRRRLLSFKTLAEQGLVTEDLEIITELCETEESIAAALVMANGARLPVSPADKILAIRSLIEKKFSAEKIGRGLCMDVGEVKKFQYVAGAHLDAINAFKSKLIDFNTLKLIARIGSLREQKSIIKQAHQNGYLNAGQVRAYLDQSGLSADSSLMKVVGLEAYVAAGGKVASDLLNELPDTCLDLGLADQLWSVRLESLRSVFENRGLDTFITPDANADFADEFGDPGYRYNRSKAQFDAINKAQQKLSEVRANLDEIGDGETLDITSCLPLCQALYDQAVANFDPMPVRAVLITPGERTVLNIEFATLQTDIAEWLANKEAVNYTQSKMEEKTYDVIPMRKILLDTTGSSNTFHRQATEMSVRGFQRSLADSFGAALKLQVSTMFEQVVLSQSQTSADERALKVTYGRNVQTANYGAIEGLDQEIVDRLMAYKKAYTEQGRRPYEWVSSLAFGQIQDLLALMTAASVWITEEATSAIRRLARAQIQEVAEEIDHDIRHHWFPSASFYAKGSKKQLLSYAERMGCEAETISTLKKAELASFVAEQGVAHHWVPPSLSFENSADLTESDDASRQECSGDDGELADIDFESDDALEAEDEPELEADSLSDAA